MSRHATLVVDRLISPPPPLNRHLASVSLQVISNQVSNGYDLSVTAHVSNEQIQLSIGDALLDVDFSIRKFEIDMRFVRSEAEFGKDYNALVDEAESRYKHYSKEEQTSKTLRSVGGRIGVDSDFAGKLDLGKSRSSHEVYETNTRTFRCYRHVALDCLSADNVESAGPVSGPVISNYVGWRVVPLTSDQPSGALARLRVAQPWISLTHPSIVSKNGPLTDRLRRLLGSSDSDFKREAFTTLLEKLVHLRLQEPDEQRFATLAASCVAVKPKVMRETITSEPVPEPLELDLTSVVDFLDASSPEEIYVLLEDHPQNEDEPTLDPYDPEMGSNSFDEEGVDQTSLTESETDTQYEDLSVDFVGDMAREVSRVLGFGRIDSQTLISSLIIYGEKTFDEVPLLLEGLIGILPSK
ncbi:MAG: hypothetical protein AAFV59_18480, partial [Pseudomonadota bacterium]